MNTKIGASFGLVLLTAIGVIATMLVLGMFSAKPASAAVTSAAVTVSPDKARSIGQYTIVFDVGDAGADLSVGDSITVTFPSGTGVPSAIAASAIKLKADVTLGGGADNQLVNASAVTISGRAVTITVPDMDPGSGTGDNGIGSGGTVTLTVTQAAGIQNPDFAKKSYDLDVKTSAENSNVSSGDYEIKGFVSFSPGSGKRGATITVKGGGFVDGCTTCHIRLSSQNTENPTTATSRGTGSINDSGEFTGTMTLSSGTASGGYVWVSDQANNWHVSSSQISQNAGATPRSTTLTPGSSNTVDLVDYTKGAAIDSVKISGETAEFTPLTLPEGSGDTTTLNPFKWKVPPGMGTGTKRITITDTGNKSATFNIEVVTRIVTGVPNPAAIGQDVTFSGIGYTKNGTIEAGDLTGPGGAVLNPDDDIDIDSSGAWSLTTTLDPGEDSASRTSNSYPVTATDGTLIGKTSGFNRTARTLTVSPSTAAPGDSVLITFTGMTVNNLSENDKAASVTIEIVSSTPSGLDLPGTTKFSVGSDGSGSGTIQIPLKADVGTITLEATDNAKDLNPVVATANRVAQAKVTVAAGIISVEPGISATGKTVTITGSNFPPNTTGVEMSFSGVSGIPLGGFTTDSDGMFSVQTQIPAAQDGGSLLPGAKIVRVTIGSIQGTTTAFKIAGPSISLDPPSASPASTVHITGSGFNALTPITKVLFGATTGSPSPAPLVGPSGDVDFDVTVPLLNPGTYTVTVGGDASGFTATTTFTAVRAGSPLASTEANTEDIFADLIADGNLVRVWRYSNADQLWSFYDPEPEFADVNTLKKTGAPDIVWVLVKTEQEFQGQTLFPGWNLIALK